MLVATQEAILFLITTNDGDESVPTKSKKRLSKRYAMLRWVRWFPVVGTILWIVMWANALRPGDSYTDLFIFSLLVLPAVAVSMRVLLRGGVAVSSTKPAVNYHGWIGNRSLPLAEVTHFDILDVDIFWASGAGFVVIRLRNGRRYILWGLGYASPETHNLLLEQIERLSATLWDWRPAAEPIPKRGIAGRVDRQKESAGERLVKDVFGDAPWSGNIVTKS